MMQGLGILTLPIVSLIFAALGFSPGALWWYEEGNIKQTSKQATANCDKYAAFAHIHKKASGLFICF